MQARAKKERLEVSRQLMAMIGMSGSALAFGLWMSSYWAGVFLLCLLVYGDAVIDRVLDLVARKD